MTGTGVVVLTTFLASAVEAIEMVTIVLGVGLTRGWRSTLLGAVSALALLAVIVAVLGVALTAIPIAPLRLLVGALLLLFGLQWYRKGIARVAAHGLAGYHHDFEEAPPPQTGVDWVAFVLSFKGVLLEGFEVAFIVISFGAAAGRTAAAVVAGTAAVVVIAAIGFAFHRLVGRIPRSLLQLVVGTLLTSFGTFWGLEGAGVKWPQGDLDILLLLVYYAAAALAYMVVERRALAARLEMAA